MTILSIRYLLILLFLSMFVASCQPVREISANEDAFPELQAHDFRLTSLDGQEVALSDLHGRWVLINFWATWCVPCREEMPYLQALADKYPLQLTVLAVNMREKPAEIIAFVDELDLTFPILLEPSDEMLLAYDVRGVPLSLVVSPTGEVRFRQPGPLSIAHFETWLNEQFTH